MNFIVFEGQLGAGKTNGAVLFSHWLKSLSPDTVLYSNFGMKDSRHFDSLYQLEEMLQNRSNIIVLDEAHVDLDSRSFSSNHVKFITQASFYLRKLNTTLIMTSPLFDNLDSRIRMITNMLVVCNKDKKNFYYDMYDVDSRRFLKTKKINQDVSFSLNLYDTNAIVSPIEVPPTKNDFDEFLLSLKNKSDEFYKLTV